MGRTEDREASQPSKRPAANLETHDFRKKIVSFEDLARGQKVVVIDFNGQHYRLRLTKFGRLVLTK